jgi:hypothetical protein
MRYAMTLVAVFVVTTALLPHSVRAASALPTPLYSLTALLSVAPDLSDLSKRTLLSEAERIWRREGVRLTWPSANDESGASLRVLVIDRREALNRGNRQRWPVGELVPQTGQRAIAIASIAGASRVLVEAGGRRLQLLDNPEADGYRLGVVLGRAVAHEIGHYLLATATHANRGLMRAAIDSREFADPGAKTFSLDDTAGQWLRNRLRDRLTQSDEMPLPSSGFSYVLTPTPAPRP